MISIDLTSRSIRPELMDTEPVTFEDFRACLVDLSRVNRLAFAYRPTIAFMERLVEARSFDRPIEVLDVGSGYGDTLREIAAWGAKRGIAVSLTGVDMNPWSEKAATEASQANGANIRFVTADAFAYEPPNGIDVVVSSLFTHHLSDADVSKFVAWMEAKGRLGWFVNDLHRHPVAYHFFRHASKIARFHRFVQHDGPLSIARAFSLSDWARLIASSGIDATGVDVARVAPFRITVSRIRPS